MRTCLKFFKQLHLSYIKQFSILLFILVTFSLKTIASNYYWIGGSGNWSDLNHWATTSGGSTFQTQIPTALDDVFFDANSFSAPGQVVNFDALTTLVRDLNWTGVTNMPSMDGSNLVKIYGSLVLVSAINFNLAGQINFESTTAGKTITMAGQHFLSDIEFNGPGGTWTLLDDLTMSGTIILSAGTFNSNDQLINAVSFSSTSGNIRTFNMGSSVFNLSGNTVWQIFATGLTVNCGTSVINVQSGSEFLGDYSINNSFYNLNFIGGSGESYIGGVNTFHNVDFGSFARIAKSNTIQKVTFRKDAWLEESNHFGEAYLTPGYTYELNSGTTQTIDGIISASGNCGALVTINSNIPGSYATISHPAGIVDISFAILHDIHTTGGANFTATSSTDLGNNTGWTFNSSASQNMYWIGNGGNWGDGSHWSLSSGGPASGCSPSPLDNVIFDANSFSSPGQSVTINVPTALCRDMNWTGVTNTPTFSLPITSGNILKIYGSLIFTPDMVIDIWGYVNFEAITPGHTIKMNGQHFLIDVYFNGIGGGWMFLDEFTANSSLNLNAGSLNFNDQTVNISAFYSTPEGNSTRSLNMTSSTINVAGGGTAWSVHSTGITLNCGTSVINIPSGQEFFGDNFGILTYYDLNFIGSSTSESYIGGTHSFHYVDLGSFGRIQKSNTFQKATFHGDAWLESSNHFGDLYLTPGQTYSLFSGTTQTIDGIFSGSGNCGSLVTINSNSPGNFATISHPAGAVNISFAIIQDIHTTGGANFTANTSTDLGNNAGWTFNASSPQNIYWVGNGGNWGDVNHWSLTSGGAPSGCTPSPLDNVIFDASSFSSSGQTVTINVPTAFCRDMNWTGVSHAPTFSLPLLSESRLKIYGSLVFAQNMTLAVWGEASFEAVTPGHTITMNGQHFSYTVSFNGTNGEWTLLDTFTIDGEIVFNAGIFNMNNQLINASYFTSLSGNARTLNMGASVFNLSGNSPWSVWSQALTMNCGTSVINISSPDASFAADYTTTPITIYDVNFTSSEGTAFITGSTIFHDVNFAANAYMGQSNHFHNVNFQKDAQLSETNFFNNINCSAGHTYLFGAGKTQTINGDWMIQGTCTNYIVLQTNTPGVAATVIKPNGSVLGHNIHIKDIHCNGGADFFAYNSVDLGGNTGWNFTTSPPLLNPGVISGPAAICLPATGIQYHISPVQGAIFYQWGVPAGATITNGQGDTLIMVDFGTATSGSISVQSFNGCSYGANNSILAITFGFGLLPVATLTTNTGTTICPGTPVTFTTTVSNTDAGTVNYNFKINGSTVQDSNSNIYTSSTIVNADEVSCEVTVSNSACFLSNTVITDTLTINVAAQLTPTVALTVFPGTIICQGAPVTYTATTANTSGYTVNYDFRINGSSIQSGSSNSFSTTSLLNNDNVNCIITISGGSCLSSPNATSNSLLITVNNLIVPAVTLSATPGTFICSWDQPVFTAIASNTTDAVLTYDFYINGTIVQSGSSNIYSDFVFNGDIVKCNISLNGGTSCYTTTSAVSDELFMMVSDPVTPEVTLNSNVGTTVCNGTIVTFSAFASNTGDGAVTYEFIVDGNTAQYGSANTYSTIFSSNASVVCQISIFGGSGCITNDFASSNTLYMQIASAVDPTVTLSANPGTSVCPGTVVTFTASAGSTGGGTVNYNFKINGSSVQNTSSNNYTTSSLANADNITCDISVSGGICLLSNTAGSNTLTMNLTAQLTPTVSLAAFPGTTICAGQSDSLTATVSNTSGGTVNYNFKVNGNSVQSGSSSSYVSSSLLNGDAVTCVITVSGGSCFTTNTATSNSLQIVISAPITPSVTLSADPPTGSCDGQPITFTATATNTGSAAITYDFQINGTSVQTGNANTYLDFSPANADIVTCNISLGGTSSCYTSTTAISNEFYITISLAVTPEVTLSASPGTTICSGAAVTFNASASNTGDGSINYEFIVDGSTAQYSNSDTYTTTLSSNANVVCRIDIFGGSGCITTDNATSNLLDINISSPINPSVTLSANPGTSVCPGTTVSFTAIAANTGSGSVNYNFKINGISVQNGSSNVYTTTALANGDNITCDITVSGGTCLLANTAISNTLVMNLTAQLTPAVSLAAFPGTTICAGQSVSFAATASNTSGGTVNYDFKVNGSSVQSGGSNSFVTTSLVSADAVTCVITVSGGSCFTTNTAISNSLVIAISTAITPSLILSADPGSSTCDGVPITFTAMASNTGSASITYDFKVNGISVQTSNSNFYIDFSPLNLDVITCNISLNGTSSCYTSTTAISNELNITITSPLIPHVTVNAIPGTTVCAGTVVSFEALATDTGNGNVIYDFNKNGLLVQSGNSSSYSTICADNDYVSCNIEVVGGSDCYLSTIAFSDPVTIHTAASFTPSVTLVSDAASPICPAIPVTFTATAINTFGANLGYDFRINGISVQSGSSNTYTTTLLGTDVVTCNISLTGGLACLSSTTATSNSLTVPIDPAAVMVNVNAGNDITIHNGETTLLNGSGDAGTFLWSPAASLNDANIPGPVASPVTTTTYILTITNANGCIGSDDVTVSVTGGRSIAVSPANAFTPNSDGINDRWIITTDNTVIAGSGHVIVMSRDGKRVYESNSYQNDWQGTYKGNALPDGTYYFVVEYKLTNGETTRLKGNVTILR